MNHLVLLPALLTVSLTSMHAAPVTGYPDEVRETHYHVAADDSEQPTLFWKPEGSEKVPLLVALHTWSGNHRQADGEAKYAEWCLKNDWIFLHPNFRGRNRTPDSMGSDLMIADIRAAVDWAKKNANVDESRIYAVGVSGGGHAAQLLAGRTPEIWAAVSSWCGISDIAAWHRETREASRDNYAEDIESALGGPPIAGSPEQAKAAHRSPLTWLENASGIPLDINHGVDDGRTGSVPFTHSLRAWNALVPESQQFSEKMMEQFYNSRKPPHDAAPVDSLYDSLYGKHLPIFRRIHNNTRITIFQGGHEIVHVAALNWLAAQKKNQPANWQPEKIADLETTDRDTESGK